jgi:ADP-L-glycero-D-manno-heptose 6-epimerase
MKILVTGGAGFVGGNLTRRLLDDGHEVTVTAMGDEVIDPRAKVTYCGLNGIDLGVVKYKDVVFHESANNDTLCKDEFEMMRVNYDASKTLFNECLYYGVKRFIFASSCSVYGNSPAPYIDGVTKEKPLNAYGKSKLAFDQYLQESIETFSNKIISLRYSNVYGPGEGHKGHRMSMIGQMIRNAMKGKTIKLFKWGLQRRDWVYIDDVVNANILAMQSNASGIFNIGYGHAYKFIEVLSAIAKETYRVIEPEFIDCPFPEAYQEYTECCIEKAKATFGYAPEYDIYSGIKKYVMHEKTQIH